MRNVPWPNYWICAKFGWNWPRYFWKDETQEFQWPVSALTNGLFDKSVNMSTSTICSGELNRFMWKKRNFTETHVTGCFIDCFKKNWWLCMKVMHGKKLNLKLGRIFKFISKVYQSGSKFWLLRIWQKNQKSRGSYNKQQYVHNYTCFLFFLTFYESSFKTK